MSNHPHPTRALPRRDPARARRRTQATAAAIGAVVVALAVVLAVGTAPDTGSGSASGDVAAASTERNEMGMPVVATPGAASGTASAGGVSVHAASWQMGQVPLNVAVRPSWELRNTGDAPIALGEPRPEVREGCCPGPITLGADSLAPGETTTMTFELGMHEGMDGPHDLAVHVPVVAVDGTEELLTVDVAGDFRN